jgi:hypothetical protein
MNPMDVWNLITVDPTNFVHQLRVWLHDISFEVWMRYLGGIVALLGLALQAKTMMIAADARAFLPVLIRVMLVAVLVSGQQPLRIAAEGWYGDLYTWGQGIIRTEATKASDTISSLSVVLGSIGIGWAGYKAGTAMAAAKGASLPEITLAGKEGAVKMILGAGQLIFALLLPIYMAYYVTMLLCGVVITLGIALLPFTAALSLVPGVGGPSALIGTTRALVTTFFVMVFMPHIFNLCLAISWNAPARVVDEALTSAWQGMVTAWQSYSVNLGIPGVDQAATAANLVLSGDGFNKVGEAIVTALLALIGGMAMIVIGMIASLVIIRRAESVIGQLVGGLAAGAASAVGMGEVRGAVNAGGGVVTAGVNSFVGSNHHATYHSGGSSGSSGGSGSSGHSSGSSNSSQGAPRSHGGPRAG